MSSTAATTGTVTTTTLGNANNGGIVTTAPGAEPAAAGGSKLLREAATEGLDIVTRLSNICKSRYQCPPLSPSFVQEAKAVILLRGHKAGEWGGAARVGSIAMHGGAHGPHSRH